MEAGFKSEYIKWPACYKNSVSNSTHTLEESIRSLLLTQTPLRVLYCSATLSIIYLLACREEMVYAPFKTLENTPPRSMTSLHLLDS